MLTVRAVALGVATALALTGCQAGPGDPAGSGAQQLREPVIDVPVTGPAAASPSAVPVSSLRTFRPTAAQAALLSRAEGLLARDCMRRLGFTWEPAPAVEPPPDTDRLLWTDGADAARAARYGYHEPRTRPRVLNTGAPDARQRAERAALSGDGVGAGVPPGGCLGEADRRLRDGEPESDAALPARLIEQAADASERDSRVTAALRGWSACLARAGHFYESPWEARSQLWADEPTPAEIALATRDVACQAETGLAVIWRVARAGYEQQLVDRHRAELDAVARTLAYRVERAGTIVGSQR